MIELEQCQCLKPKDGTTFVCPRYDKEMALRHWEICSGDCPPNRPCGDGMRRSYRASWSNQPEIRSTEQTIQKPVPNDGPGTELVKLIESLGLQKLGSCVTGCKSVAKWMDQMGVAKCQQHREAIVARLRESQSKLSWVETLTAATNAVLTGLVFKLDPRDPAPGLLDEAIRRWEEKSGFSENP